MNHLLTLAAASILAIGCAEAQNKPVGNYENTYLQYGLNCPVKSITVRHYNAVQTADGIDKGKVTANEETPYNAKFDEKGRLIELGIFIEEDFSLGEDKYIYDSDGRLSEIISYDDGKIIRTLAYSYENGFLKSIVNLAKGTDEVTREEYSNDDRYITSCKLLKDGEVASYREYSRKDDGSTIMKHYNGKGDSDALGHRISNAFGQVIEIRAAPIYATGHVTYEDTSHLPMSSSMCYVSTDGTVKGWYESDYGYTYIFDSHGNWTSRITWISAAGIPLRVTERTIEY